MRNTDIEIIELIAVDLDVNEKDLERSLKIQVKAGLNRIANDLSIVPDSKSPWLLEDMIAKEVLRDLRYPTDEDPKAVECLRSIIWQLMTDRDNNMSNTARNKFAEQVSKQVHEAHPSPRWQTVIDMLDRYGYFRGVSTYDDLYSRERPLVSASTKYNDLTIGWIGKGILIDDKARIGIDHIWNKLSDAVVILEWPTVDRLGKRRWNEIEDFLDDFLNPRSKTHRAAIRNWDKWSDDHIIDTRSNF